jgi:hypothetical protein
VPATGVAACPAVGATGEELVVAGDGFAVVLHEAKNTVTRKVMAIRKERAILSFLLVDPIERNFLVFIVYLQNFHDPLWKCKRFIFMFSLFLFLYNSFCWRLIEK